MPPKPPGTTLTVPDILGGVAEHLLALGYDVKITLVDSGKFGVVHVVEVKTERGECKIDREAPKGYPLVVLVPVPVLMRVGPPPWKPCWHGTSLDIADPAVFDRLVEVLGKPA